MTVFSKKQGADQLAEGESMAQRTKQPTWPTIKPFTYSSSIVRKDFKFPYPSLHVSS